MPSPLLLLFSGSACSDPAATPPPSGSGPQAPDRDGDGVADAADCAPDDPHTWPGAPERCDGIDNDCDGSAIEPPQAATVEGGQTHASLSEALAAAPPGATVTLCPGSHQGGVVIERDVVLRGLQQPVIDAGGASSVIEIRGGTVTLEGLILTGGTGSPDGPALTNGGGINASAADGPLTLIDCQIRDNVAELGGGLLIGPHGATLTGSSVSLNVSGTHGAGIYSSGALHLQQSTLSDNVAADSGGGLALAEGASAVLSDSEITDNTAGSGAGIFVAEDAAVDADPQSRLSGNHAQTGGGGFVSGGTWSGGLLQDNTATELGGGLHVRDGIVSDVQLVGNEAGYGGGLAAEGSIELVRVLIEANTATDAAGAYLLEADVEADDDTWVHANRALEAGGGLSLVDATWRGGRVSHNEAQLGAGIALSTFAAGGSVLRQLQIEDNLAGTSGAGVYATGPWQLDGCVIERNTAADRGGGLYSTAGVGTVDDTVIGGNGASNRGGGIYLDGASVATMRSVTLEGNRSLRGAGAYLNGDSTLSLLDSTIWANGDSTTISGGGVRVTDGTLLSTCSGWDTQPGDNAPDDVFVEGSGGVLGYAACETFSCTPATGCSPEPDGADAPN